MTEEYAELYLPSHFLSECSSSIYRILGCVGFDDRFLINCLVAFPHDISNKMLVDYYFAKFLSLLDKMDTCFAVFHMGSICPQNLQDSSELQNYESKFQSAIKFKLILNEGSGEIVLKNLMYSEDVIPAENVRVILYEPVSFVRSHLLLANAREMRDIDNYGSGFENSFLNFVCVTVKLQGQISSYLDKLDSSQLIHAVPVSPKGGVLSCFFELFSAIFWTCFGKVCHSCSSIRRLPNYFRFILHKSEVGAHVEQRCLQLKYVWEEKLKRENSTSLCAKNILFGFALDLLCGWLIIYLLQTHVSSKYLLQNIMCYTNRMVNTIEDLIHWLMGVPAGLKLNIPLNSALGHLFLYHIYLWKSYMIIVEPTFAFMLDTLFSIGALGFTFIPSLVNDMISFATVHIYIFYGYAAKIYHYQLLALSYFWKLFRGKKWNPELQRVEAHQYDTHHLYIGTMIFTVLFFLLPTVMVYYYVFTMLRIIILTIQGILSRVIKTLTSLPAFAVILSLSNSIETTGNLHFQVVQKEQLLVLSLKVLQMPVTTVVSKTLPRIEESSEATSWKSFFSSIAWGKIIYPI